MWELVAILAGVIAFFGLRHWIAFRKVRSFEVAFRRLGNPVGHRRAEVEEVMGPPTTVVKPDHDKELLMWAVEGGYSLLLFLTIHRREEAWFLFHAGVCQEMRSSGSAMWSEDKLSE